MESQPDTRDAEPIPRSRAVGHAAAVTGDTPTGIAVAAGAVAVVGAAAIAAVLPVSAGAPRLGVMAVALGAFAAATADARAAAVVTVLGWLVFDGFVVNQFGELTWTGRRDEGRFAVLVAGAGVGLAAGLLRRWAEVRRVDAELAALSDG